MALYRGAADLFWRSKSQNGLHALKHLGDLAPEDEKAVDERIKPLEGRTAVELNEGSPKTE